MMTPDRNIVRKIQEYDKDLYVEWNNQFQYFEVWRKCAVGRRLITPVTKSIYFEKGKKEFVELDERICRWLYDADTWKSKSIDDHHAQIDKRWEEYYKRIGKKRRQYFRDVAKDIYSISKGFFCTKHKSKDGKPKFEGKRKSLTWVKPDSGARTSKRLFTRTPQNIKQYFGE